MAGHDTGEPEVYQLVVPAGALWEMTKQLMRAAGWAVVGPIPLEQDDVPTYILQPLTKIGRAHV